MLPQVLDGVFQYSLCFDISYSYVTNVRFRPIIPQPPVIVIHFQSEHYQ